MPIGTVIGDTPIADSDFGTTGTFVRISEPMFNSAALPTEKICLNLFVSGNMIFAATAGASVTKVEARLVDSAGTVLATFEIIPATLVNDLLTLDMMFSLVCKTNGISNSRLFLTLTDIDPTGIGSSSAYTRFGEVTTDFTWPADGLVYLEVSATGATFRFNMTELDTSYEEKLYYA